MIELIDYTQVSGYSSRIDATSEFAFLLYLNVKVNKRENIMQI